MGTGFVSPFLRLIDRQERAKVMKPPKMQKIIARGVEATVKSWPTYLGEQLNRNDYVTASEVGSCLRKAYLTKTVPMKAGLDQWGYAERGHAVEAWVVEKLRLGLSVGSEGYAFDYLGDDQVSFHYNYQSGTPDGLVTLGDDVMVLDIKSIDPRTNRKYLPKRSHVMQVHQNAYLIRECLKLNVVGTILFYIDASNFESSKQIDLDLDENLVAETIERARRIKTATKQSDLPPEGLMTSDGCNYCDVKQLCTGFADKDAAHTKTLAEAERAMENVFRRR